MRAYIALLSGLLLCSTGCPEDPLGGPCNTDDKEELVYEKLGDPPEDGKNIIAQHVAAFKSCETRICLSTNGSKPYCTISCVSDQECLNSRGIAMTCKEITEFGPLACVDPHERDDCLPGESEDDICCERSTEDQAVLHPARYCAAKDGAVAHDPKASKEE